MDEPTIKPTIEPTKPKKSKTLLVIAIIATFLAIGAIVWAIIILVHKKNTIATITSSTCTPTVIGGPATQFTCKLTVSYTGNNQPQNSNITTNPTIDTSPYAVGKTLTVQYDTSNPTNIQFPSLSGSFGAYGLILAAVVLLMGGWFPMILS